VLTFLDWTNFDESYISNY